MSEVNQCYIDNCEIRAYDVHCPKCDGDFCTKHFEQYHKNGACEFQ